MKEPYTGRISDPPWPGVMRRLSVRRRRSVDRGCAGRGIELRNHPSRWPTLLCDGEGNTSRCESASAGLAPAESKPRGMSTHFLHGNREILEVATITFRLWSGWERSVTVIPA